MTPDELERLLKPQDLSFMYTESDGLRLAEAMAGLDESQRKKLSKVAKAYYRQLNSGPRLSNDHEFAGLAALAVCQLSDARKVLAGYFQRQEKAAIKILLDRRPEWLDQWVSEKLSARFPQLSWNLLRALIRAGACRKPDHPAYAQLMASWVAWHSRNDGQRISVSQRLLDEPDLLDDVWRLFELDGYTFFDEQSPWTLALGELAERGILDRQRLIDCSLTALDNDNATRSGFVRFYQSMCPTPDERTARQQRFLQLLSYRATPVVTFALEQLGELEQQDTLDGEAFLAAVKSVFALKPKVQPLAALKLVARLAKAHVELLPAAVEASLAALRHDSAAVQAKAADLLLAWQSRLHGDHMAEIRDCLTGLAPTVRQKIQPLIERPVAATKDATGAPASSSARIDFDYLRKSAENLPAKWRHLAGIDDALEAGSKGCLPPPLTFTLLDVPVLTAAEKIIPIQTVDELLDAVAHALEVLDSSDELERILDGISRLGDQRPADFDLRAAPLLKRMRDVRSQDSNRGLLSALITPFALQNLTHVWLCRRQMKIEGQRFTGGALNRYTDLRKFIDLRVGEIERRVLLDQAAPVLAAPTHRRGWIDPREFVRRLKTLSAANIQPPQADLIQALLRLAPDHRDIALYDTDKCSGPSIRAVRWALGSDVGPTAEDRDQFALWLAAGRCRNPCGVLKELAEIVPAKEAAYALLPPTYSWRPESLLAETVNYRSSGSVELKVVAHPREIASDALHSRPTLALYEPTHHNAWAISDPWATQWLATVWPLNTDPYLADGAQSLSQRVNAPASSLEPNYVYLLPLIEPDRPWDELAYLVVCMALISKDADSRGAAIDALILAIDDGRMATKTAAEVLLRLLPGGWVKLNRVADVCREIAHVSPLHGWWAADLLERALQGMSTLPNAAHHWLTLLLELLSDLQLPPAATTRDALTKTKLSGKAAKAVAQMLKLQAAGISATAAEALRRAIESRITRAARWTQTGDSS